LTSIANELRAIRSLPLGEKSDLWDISATGTKIWDLLEESERLRDISFLEEAGRLLWEQITRDPFTGVDCVAYKSLATAAYPDLYHGHAYYSMSKSVGESDSSGILREDGYSMEVNMTTLATSFSSAPQSTSLVASAIRPRPNKSINTSLPHLYLLDNTPPFSEPANSYPIETISRDFYANNFSIRDLSQHAITEAVNTSLSHKAPATPAPPTPENVDSIDKVHLSPENGNTVASPKTKKQRSVSRGHDLFKTLGLSP